MENRSLDISADAPVEYFIEFRHDVGALGHHSADLNEGVQVDLSQVTQFILHW